ncbi:MAG: class I SAM-dependent methyltransferase [Myxococcota bacterium]
MTRGRNALQLLFDRVRKHGWYDSAAYWNMKARSYTGAARSFWPSNNYNAETHRLHLRTIENALHDVRGLHILDLGCGTGRLSIELAKRGAQVTGWDFAEDAIECARSDARAQGVKVDFHVVDVRRKFPSVPRRFDAVLSVSCLVLACRTRAEFDAVVSRLVAVCAPGARVLLLEPIHTSRLLRRILKMSEKEWISACEKHGLSLLDRGALSFVPARYAFAFRDAPDALVAPLFWAGERLLEKHAALHWLGDYKWHLYRATTRAD